MTTMHIRITDADTGRELWTIAQCAEYCGITPVTWRSYTRKNIPPAPITHLNGHTPLWVADDVKHWHASRPGRGNWGQTPI